LNLERIYNIIKLNNIFGEITKFCNNERMDFPMGNIALGGNMTASNYIAPFTASRAVNGSTAATSRWVGEVSSTAPGSIMLSLNGNAFVNRWVIRHMSVLTGWSAPQYSMSDYSLQGSLDGTTWYTIDSVSGNTASVTDRTFTAVYYRFYRVVVTKGLNNNNKIASIMEFELYEAPATSQYLSNLTISSGTLTPAFGKNTYSYTASVGTDISSIVVTPTAEVPTYLGQNATIKVNGVPVASGTGTPVNLALGVNTIYIDVTSALGGATQRYTITVTRVDTYLSNLIATATMGTTNILQGTFDKTVTTYSGSIANTAKIKITATADSPQNVTLTIGGAAATSGTALPVTVTAGTTNTINIIVTWTNTGDTKTYTCNIAVGS